MSPGVSEAPTTFSLCCCSRPFDFVALLGVIALMSMITRKNSVILID